MRLFATSLWLSLIIAAATVLPGPVGAEAVSGKLVLYTSQPERDAAQTIAAFKAVNPGIEVEIFRSGTTEIMAKLGAEFSAGQPRPDVLLIADAASMEALKTDGRLLAYPQARVDGLEAGSFDPDRTYFGSKLITTGIVVNTGAKLRPAAFADLAGPAYKDQLSMPSPLYSGAAAIMLGAMSTRGDLGWDYIRRLHDNGAIAVRGNGAVLKAVATGEKPYGILVDFMAYNAKAQGSPIDFIVPAEGSPSVTEPVAILKSASNIPAGKAFVDFIVSDAGQALAVKMGYIPARASAGSPAWLPKGSAVKLMPADIAAIVKTNEADRKRFSDLFGN